MEIGGIPDSSYMKSQVESKKGNVESADFEKKLQGAVNKKDDDALKKVCQDFEAIFLNMMYKEMKNTVIKSDLVKDSYEKEVFQGMLDEKMMNDASKSKGMGLAQSLYKQLKKTIE